MEAVEAVDSAEAAVAEVATVVVVVWTPVQYSIYSIIFAKKTNVIQGTPDLMPHPFTTADGKPRPCCLVESFAKPSLACHFRLPHHRDREIRILHGYNCSRVSFSRSSQLMHSRRWVSMDWLALLFALCYSSSTLRVLLKRMMKSLPGLFFWFCQIVLGIVFHGVGGHGFFSWEIFWLWYGVVYCIP